MTPFVLVVVDAPVDAGLLDSIAEATTLWSSPAGYGREPPYGWGQSASMRRASSPTDVMPGEVQVLMLSHPDSPNALGYHDRDAHGLPIVKVFPRLLDDVAAELAGVITHEVGEVLADPELSRTAIGADNRIRALEPCDPVETLNVPITIASGQIVQCSAWVTPAWFEPPDNLTGIPLAVGVGADAVTQPGQILPGGYMSYLTNGQWSQESIGSMRSYRARMAGLGAGRHAKRAARRGEF